MHSRSGTFLLFVLAAMTLTVVLVFAFLKAVELQRNEAVSAIFPTLAQQTALYGVRHAQEELIKDFRREAVSMLDAPGRALFRAADQPMTIQEDWADASSERVADQVDVAMEARISRPLWEDKMFKLGGNNLNDSSRDWFYVPGRGRWFEPEFRNRSDPVATARPAPVPFPWDDGADIDGSSAGDQEPGTLSANIQSPIAYDATWNRLTVSGSATDARNVRRYARYRLRYAAALRDLDGAILINPDPDIDWRNFTRADPRIYTDLMQRMVARHMHLVPAVASALLTFQPPGSDYGGAPLVLQHIFLGRGHGSNIARAELPLDGTSVDPAPRAFPLMYRSSADVRGHGDTLYGYDGVVGSELGGQQLPLSANRNSDSKATGLMLTGPQASPYNLCRAAYRIGSDTPLPLLMACTPFGRGLSGKALADGSLTSGPYDGWTSTPWKVNALTAPPAVLRALLYAYFPPGVVTANVTGVRFCDLFNETHSDAFAYRAPQGTSPVYPDYRAADTRTAAQRYPGSLMVNSGGSNDSLGQGILVSALPFPVLDPYLYKSIIDTGDAARRPAANSFWNDIAMAFSNAMAVAKRGQMRLSYTKFNRFVTASDPPYQMTINPAVDENVVAGEPLAKVASTRDLDRLFLACLGIDMAKLGPGVADATAWLWTSATQATSGSNATTPRTDGRAAYIKAVKDTATARVTIRSLYTTGLLSAEQSSVMELVLNDFRLSFFGSDPAYTPSFRPLDFNGDGYATCSAYRSDRASARKDPARITLGIGQESRADADGQGEWSIADVLRPAGDTQRIVPFCISGCLYVGRSHFWEVMVRGEVYDNQLKRPVANATLQTVIAIDPEGRIEMGKSGDQRQNQVLFQRWYYDRYSALMGRE